MRRLVFIIANVISLFTFVNSAIEYKERILYIDGLYYSLPTIDWPEWLPDSIKPEPYAVLTNGDSRYYRWVDTVSTITTKDAEPVYFPDHGYYSGDIVIPDHITYNDTIYPVVAIDEYTFSKCEDLTSVKIPSSVTVIGNFAFHACKKLKNLELPQTLKGIGEGFLWMSGIKEITLPDSILSLALTSLSGPIIRFSEKHVDYDNGAYAIVFQSSQHKGCRPNSNAAEGAFLLPKCRFHLRWGSFKDGFFKTVIFPDIERFYSHQRAFDREYPEQIVCLGKVPPIIDRTNYWSTHDPDDPGPSGPEDEPTRDESGLMLDYSHTTLIVPKGSEEAYREAYVWGNFETIVGVESFDEYLGKDQAAVGLPSAEAEATIAFTRTGIEVTAPAATTVEVTTLTGIAVARHTATAGSPLAIDLAPGLYIVKAGATVKKIKI